MEKKRNERERARTLDLKSPSEKKRNKRERVLNLARAAGLSMVLDVSARCACVYKRQTADVACVQGDGTAVVSRRRWAVGGVEDARVQEMSRWWWRCEESKGDGGGGQPNLFGVDEALEACYLRNVFEPEGKNQLV